MCEIKETLYDWFLGSNEAISTMASSMIAKFDKYSSKCSIVMAIAVILAPRYKMKLFEFYFPIMYDLKLQMRLEKFVKNVMICFSNISQSLEIVQINHRKALHQIQRLPT